MTATKLRAYHGNKKIKGKYLARVRKHAKADEIIHGVYWERGKGCAVGCTIHSSVHSRYESELGIPQIVAKLEDRIFEGLANGDSKKFPAQFLNAIRPSADLSRVGPAFLVAVLERRLEKLAPETWGVRAAIEQCLAVVRAWRDIGRVDPWAASAAANAASAADSAASAARAASAADSAYNAEWAARAAANAASAASAADSAYNAEWKWMRDTLLDLLRAAPIAKEVT